MTHSIKVSSVTKTFGSYTALDNVTISMEEASCVGLLGPNGAGKSTLLKSITNIIKPSRGRIEINGVHVSSSPKQALRNVGSLVEFPQFYPYLTGLESLYFVCRVKGLGARQARDEIERVSALTGATRFLDRKTGGYSRGMNQRLALSSALIGNPEILILDEPTFGLDPKGMRDIRTLIRKINSERESLILLSSHLIYEINEVCDRVVIINGGRIAYDSSTPESDGWISMHLDRIPEDLSFLEAFTDTYKVDSGRLITKMKKEASSNAIIDTLIKMGIEIKSFGEYDTLEDIYLSIVNGEDIFESTGKVPATQGEPAHNGPSA